MTYQNIPLPYPCTRHSSNVIRSHPRSRYHEHMRPCRKPFSYKLRYTDRKTRYSSSPLVEATIKEYAVAPGDSLADSSCGLAMERRQLQAIYAAERRRPPYNHAKTVTDIGRNAYRSHRTGSVANGASISAQQGCSLSIKPRMCIDMCAERITSDLRFV